jgi:DNA-binding PadR family transcriptional regulator
MVLLMRAVTARAADRAVDRHRRTLNSFSISKGGKPVSQFLPDRVRLHILYQAEMAPIQGAWMARELGRLGYELSPATLYPVLYRMEDEGLLRSDQQVVDGRARQVFGITPIGLSALRRLEFDETRTHP